MQKPNILMMAAIILIFLGILMIYLGVFNGPKIVLPPLITGIGFFVMAWAFIKMRN